MVWLGVGDWREKRVTVRVVEDHLRMTGGSRSSRTVEAEAEAELKNFACESASSDKLQAGGTGAPVPKEPWAVVITNG